MSFPRPLDNKQWWNLGSWFLPATTLSFASAFIVIFIFLYVYFGKNLRTLFTLPIHQLPDPLKQSALVMIACIALLFSVYIALKTSPRPSRLFVKLWALIVVVIAGIALFLILKKAPPSSWNTEWWQWTSFRHTLLLASAMSVITLLPRLLKPRVDSRSIQYITPIVLLLLAPLSAFIIFIGDKVEIQQQRQVESMIEGLNNELSILNEVFSNDTDATITTKSAKLQKLMGRPPVTTEILSIAKLMLESNTSIDKTNTEQIKENYSQILKSIKNLTNNSNLPSIYSNARSPFKYKDGNKWVLDKEVFEENNEIAKYYRTLDQYLSERKKELGESPLDDFERSKEKISSVVADLKEKLNSRFNNWMDHWLVYQMPEIFPENKYSEGTFIDSLIQMSVFNNSSFAKMRSMTRIVGTPGTQDAVNSIVSSSKACFHEKTSILRCYAYNGDSEGTIVALEYRLQVKNSKKGRYTISLMIPSVDSTASLSPDLVKRKLETAINNQYSASISLPTPSYVNNDIGSINYYGNGQNTAKIKLEHKKAYKKSE